MKVFEKEILKQKIALALILPPLVGAALFAAYMFGHNQGYSQGHSIGAQASVGDSHSEWERSLTGQWVTKVANEEYPKLQQDYNALASEYNELRNAVIQYAGATQYQARQPIHCNSYTYGMGSVSTSCY